MFRFTIRDVLWLTAMAALAVAWWLDRSQLASALSRAEVARKYTARANKVLVEFLETQGYRHDGLPPEVFSE
jgi:hypothetical protein